MKKTSTILLCLLLSASFGAVAQEKRAPEEVKKAPPRADLRRVDFSRCVIKPVMSDDDLRRCGATPAQPKI